VVKRNVVGDLQAAADEESDTEGCRLDGDAGQDRPIACATPRTEPVRASAPARSAGGTIETT
jgi:hypothetical protein